MSDVTRILKEARDQGRLTALDFAQGIFDDFIELHGDRNFRDDGAVIGGIGRLNGQAVTVVGIQKGKNLQDNSGSAAKASSVSEIGRASCRERV